MRRTLGVFVALSALLSAEARAQSAPEPAAAAEEAQSSPPAAPPATETTAAWAPAAPKAAPKAAAAAVTAPKKQIAFTSVGVQSYVEIPPEGASMVAVQLGPTLPISDLPHTFMLGLAYSFSLNGPLLMELAGGVGLGGDAIVLHLAPGVRYLMPIAALPWLPYVTAALAVDMVGGGARFAHDLAVGLELAAGLRYYFLPELGVGPELNFTLGLAAGQETVPAFGAAALIAVVYRLP